MAGVVEMGGAPAVGPDTGVDRAGTTQLARIRPRPSSASARVRPIRPALAVITWTRPRFGRWALRPPMLTMAPLRSCGKRRNSSRDVRNAPVSVTSSTAVQAARVVVSRGSSGRIAALLTRMDTGPSRVPISSKPCRTADSSSTRTSMPQRSSAPPPIAPNASSSATGSDAPQTQTRAPAARRVCAIARPMFRLPPVTRATSAPRSGDWLMSMTAPDVTKAGGGPFCCRHVHGSAIMGAAVSLQSGVADA